MTDTIRWIDRSELITEITHGHELLDNWEVESARDVVKTLCMKLAEHTPQLDWENITTDTVRSYLNGIESLLEIREAA